MTKLYEKLVKSCPSGTEVKRSIPRIVESIPKTYGKHLLMNILNCVDLTTLNPTDTKTRILQLTGKVNSFQVRYSNIPNVAGICVFPNYATIVKDRLTAKNVKIVSVAGSFPTSQTFRNLRVAESKMAVDAGAEEIDVMINLGAFLGGDYETVISEISEIKSAIGNKTLKVIIESGCLNGYEQIFKASMLAMDAGADFIKTSTGKNGIGATPEAAYVICKAISCFYGETGIQVGFKAAGGISEVNDAVVFYQIVSTCLGDKWLNNKLFRIGASRLANNILSEIAGERHEHF
ncbi:MAG: deoxyribose-phosphate aldolase [Bacteroidales bacterium]|jgi:deoxyribose-phosphate aldolase